MVQIHPVHLHKHCRFRHWFWRFVLPHYGSARTSQALAVRTENKATRGSAFFFWFVRGSMFHRADPQRELVTADGSRIAELLGRVTTGSREMSVARIVMSPGRGQPARRNRFDEVLIVISGSCEVDLPGGTMLLQPDDVLELPARTPYAERGGPEGCVAWAICTPAFSRDLVEFLV